MIKRLKEHLDDVLLLIGCCCILYGLAQWNATVAWVAAGLLMFGWAFLIGRVRAKEKSNVAAK